MEKDVPGQSRNGGRPDWFLTWLREVFLPASKDAVASQIELFEDAVEKIPKIDESVKKSLINTLTNEARISLAREDDKSKISQLFKSQTLPAEETASPMPWDKLTESEAKIISKIMENLKELDFSTKSLKFWSAHFSINFSWLVSWAESL